jgi:hypothetical protein
MSPPELCLPQEIIDDIIAYLQGDHSTLSTCATVSRSLLGPTRRQLYHTLSLSTSHVSHLNHMASTLLTNPELLSYTRVVYLEGIGLQKHEYILLPLLHTLTDRSMHLHAFTLIPGRSSCGTWEANYTVPIRTALLNLFKISSLHTLRMKDLCLFHFPFEIFGLSTCLRYLDLEGNHRDEYCLHIQEDVVALPLFQRSTKTYLDVLSISDSNAVPFTKYLSHPDCPVKLTRLRELRIQGTQAKYLATLSDIIALASNTLESYI